MVRKDISDLTYKGRCKIADCVGRKRGLIFSDQKPCFEHHPITRVVRGLLGVLAQARELKRPKTAGGRLCLGSA